SCPYTQGCVLTTINVIEERKTANCRVVIAQTGSIRVIKRERDITNGGVFRGDLVKEKRGSAKRVVAESVSVTIERTGADSVVEGTINVLRERLSANCRVAGKRVRLSYWWRFLTNLVRVDSCLSPINNVNAIFYEAE